LTVRVFSDVVSRIARGKEKKSGDVEEVVIE
jgi:hypothetical protein